MKPTLPNKNSHDPKARMGTTHEYEYDAAGKPVQWDYSTGNPTKNGLKLKGIGLQKTNSKKHALDSLINRFVNPVATVDWYPARWWVAEVVLQLTEEKLENGIEKIKNGFFHLFFDDHKVLKDISDADFAFQRVGGVNPCILKQFTSKDEGVFDNKFPAEKTKSYYFVDYIALKKLQGNSHAPDKNAQTHRYVYYPATLFEVDSKNEQLKPVAINVRCENKSEVVTPAASKKWEAAKWIVQNADINYHELITHLGKTHLYTEAFAVAAGQCLPENDDYIHPLSHLLRPHFEGTVNINDFATTNLIDLADKDHPNQGGVFDLNFTGTMESNVAMLAEEVFGIGRKDCSKLFEQHVFIQDISDRGVGRFAKEVLEGVNVYHAYPEDLGFYYPYLEDACALWNAITDWVCRYITIYYTSDADVKQDCELQAWAEMVVKKGGIIGFGDNSNEKCLLTTRSYLVKAITSIIFNASVQHAAVNFPQADYGATLPAGIYHDFFSDGDNYDNVEKYLPNSEHQSQVMNTLKLLSSVKYTTLGTYHSNTSSPMIIRHDYFPEEVKTALEDFQSKLKSVAKKIQHRNNSLNQANKKYKYEYLLPENIPQSINI
jgi:arachidonate 15-lipoxygenase